MGGNRFAVETLRMSAATFEEISCGANGALRTLGFPRVLRVEPLRSKSSHGDIDLLVDADVFNAFGIDAVADALGAARYARNGQNDRTPSFLIETREGVHQLDLTLCAEGTITFNARLLAWGDAGALLSMMARGMGLNLANDALKLRTGDRRQLIKVPMISDFDRALEAMGLDPRPHREGFDNEGEVFEWLASGANFEPDSFALESMTNAGRKRSSSRKMQNAFREYISGLERRWALPEPGDDRGWEAYWKGLYPDVVECEVVLRAGHEAKIRRRSVLDSAEISQVTGLEGNSLRYMIHSLTKDALGQAAISSGDKDLLLERASILRLEMVDECLA